MSIVIAPERNNLRGVDGVWSGQQTFEDPILIPDGAVGAPGWAFSDDDDNGAYRIGDNNWALAVAGVKALEFTTSQVQVHKSTLAFQQASTIKTTTGILTLKSDDNAIHIKPGTGFNGFIIRNAADSITVFAVEDSSVDLGVSIIPTTDNARDLGTASLQFRTAYLGTKIQVPEIDTASGDLTLNPADAVVLPDNKALGLGTSSGEGTLSSNGTDVVLALTATATFEARGIAAGPITAERVPSAPSDAIYSGVLVRAVKSSDMGNGFGASVLFEIEDDAAVENFLGAVGAVRNGADNTGKLALQTYTAGVAGVRAYLSASSLDFQQATDITTTTGNLDLSPATGQVDINTVLNVGLRLMASGTPIGQWNQVGRNTITVSQIAGRSGQVLIVGASGGELIQSCPTAFPADADLENGELTFRVDEASSTLEVRVKKSNASLLTGVFGVQQSALTAQETTITHTAPGAPDFALQDLVDSGAGSAFGFATKDEGNTVLQVVANLQTRVQELEDALQAYGALA